MTNVVPSLVLSPSFPQSVVRRTAWMAARWLGSPAEAQSEADVAEAEAGGASVSGFTR